MGKEIDKEINNLFENELVNDEDLEQEATVKVNFDDKIVEMDDVVNNEYVFDEEVDIVEMIENDFLREGICFDEQVEGEDQDEYAYMESIEDKDQDEHTYMENIEDIEADNANVEIIEEKKQSEYIYIENIDKEQVGNEYIEDEENGYNQDIYDYIKNIDEDSIVEGYNEDEFDRDYLEGVDDELEAYDEGIEEDNEIEDEFNRDYLEEVDDELEAYDDELEKYSETELITGYEEIFEENDNQIINKKDRNAKKTRQKKGNFISYVKTKINRIKKINKKTIVKIKRASLVLLGIAITFLVLGAILNKESKKIYKIDDEVVYIEEFGVYAMEYIDMYSIEKKNQLTTKYATKQTFDEYYKERILEEIKDNKKMYLCAMMEGIKLTKSDEDIIEKNTEKWIENIGKDKMKQYNVSRKYVKKVITERYYKELLKDTAIKNVEIKELVQYAHTYNLLFRTIMVDEEGQIMTDEKGNALYISDAEKKIQKQKAEDALALMESGKTIEEVAIEYGIEDVSGDLYGNKNTFFEEYANEVYRLKDGQISRVVETTYGYNVFELITLNDEIYSEQIGEYEISVEKEDNLNSAKEKWLEELNVGDGKIYKKNYDKLSLANYL